MSSVSEDEDELLQIALKEQSQRDLNYRRTAVADSSRSSKPIANYVQPPPLRNRAPPPAGHPKNPSASNSHAGQMANGRRRSKIRSIDEDEDSEVELLSISSGDEDSSKASAYNGKGRGGGIGVRSEKKDEVAKIWDGEEPDCWKRVDEAELARRVWEMRETKTVPVTQEIEKKPSAMGKKMLNNLQSFPRGMECIDPLGLGIIDNKSLTLITASSASSASMLDKDSVNNDLREKLAYFSEKFDAKFFLSRIHQVTPAADLEAGLTALKSDLQGRTQQRQNLVKENFDCFVSCKTTIDDIESKLRWIEEDREGAGTTHLYNCIQAVSTQASRAFEPLFERQAQAEKIRSVQGMLQRFRTLFNLPSTIRSSISKGEYDLAVRDYRKAKSIVLPSHVGILKRVLEEVEKVMHEFKSTLYRSMEDPNINLAELESTVRLLLELEPESDPVWHYLNIQNQRIKALIETCAVEHEARMESLCSKMRERALSDVRWIEMQQGSSLFSDVNGTTTMVDSESVKLTSKEVDALRGKCICRLTAVLIHYMPAFWKVALSVLSGKFAKVSADDNVSSTATKVNDRVQGKYSSHSLDEVAGMMRSTISIYEAKVLTVFHDFEESNILQPYVGDAIREISRACQALEVKDSAPSLAVSVLRAMHAEMSKTYMFRLCSWMRTSIETLSKYETWIPVSVIERNKSAYTISDMPLSFRSVIISAMDKIHTMLQTLESEATKAEGSYIPFQEIQESVRISFLNCFLDFAGYLEYIGTERVQNRLNNGSVLFSNGHSSESSESMSELLLGCVTDPHQQLLMVLSNVGYCKDELCHELYNKYQHVWSNSKDRDEGRGDKHDLLMAFCALEDKILEQYTLAKAKNIREAALNYLLDTGIQWGAAPPVKGVRDAAVDLLHALVAVHAEVFANAKPLLDKTLGVLVEGLIDTLLSLFDENRDKYLRLLDGNGFCQLMLELDYLETVLNPYFTQTARDSLKSLQGVLLEKATESVIESVENPGHSRRSTRSGEDLQEERLQGLSVSPDDLIAIAQKCSAEILGAELERTRLNIACFEIPQDLVPENAKSHRTSSAGGRGGGSLVPPPGKINKSGQDGLPAHYGVSRSRRKGI